MNFSKYSLVTLALNKVLSDHPPLEYWLGDVERKTFVKHWIY